MNITAIERGTYARFALATPDDGDQAVEVFQVVDGSDHPDADLKPGFYWQQPPEVDPTGPFSTEDEALNGARQYYGY